MHKLLWIGSPFFANDMAKCGWDLRFHNFEHTAVFHWQDLVELADGPPDVLVVADKSRPPFVLGMENFPCLTIFYCVDSHIHSYYPYYAQGFDVCLVSLRDHIERFQNLALANERIIHAPAFAKDDDLPQIEPESILNNIIGTEVEPWDLLFVGNVNPETTPLRKDFLDHLGQEIPGLHVTRGDYRSLFPKAKIVLNYCELGDLNFRVFEALGCGSCLLTPMVGHGFTEIFTPGKDLFTYEMKNWEDAAAKVRWLLEHPGLRLEAAKLGQAKVNASHRAIHRAEALTNYLLNLASPANIPGKPKSPGYSAETLLFQNTTGHRLARAKAIHHKYLRFIYLLLAEQMDDPLLKKSYLAAGKPAE